MPVFGHFALRLQGKTGKLAFWLGNCAHFCGFRGRMQEHLIMLKTLVFVLKNTKILQRTKRASRPLFAQNWTKFFRWKRSAKWPKMAFLSSKKRAVLQRERQFAKSYLFHAYTPPPPPHPLNARNGNHLSCWRFPMFYSFFCLKVGHFPFKTYGKDQWWIRRSKSPKQPEMPIKQAKTSEHHNWPRYRKWPQIGPTNTIEQGKKRRNEKWYLVRANPRNHPPNGVLCSKTRDFEHLGLKC